MEIEFKRPEITADTDILSTVVVTDGEGKEHTADYGELLVKHGQDYLTDVRNDGYIIRPIDDFEEDALEEDITNWDAFEEAFMSKHWSTTHWKESVLTRIEPMDLNKFQQQSKYFTWDVEGHLIFIEDDLTLAAWLESKFIISKDEKVEFVKYCFENGRIK